MSSRELIKRASIYCREGDLIKKCPLFLKERMLEIEGVLRSYERSFKALGLDEDEKLYAGWVAQERREVLEAIAEHILNTVGKPDNYESLSKIYDVVKEIEGNFDCSNKRIKYDMFRAKTGRLATKSNSFPILNLPKERRVCITPKKDLLVEFDYNAMDLRVLLGLSNARQPDVDIHDWIRKEVFLDTISREESKKKAFSWLYGKRIPEAAKFEKIFNKDKICEEFYEDGQIKNLYDRVIQCDSDFFALNYVVQSTANDLFFEQVYKVKERLGLHNSKILFCIHDCLVLDVDKTELHLLKEVREILENTRLGKFKINIKAGKNYGDMRAQ